MVSPVEIRPSTTNALYPRLNRAVFQILLSQMPVYFWLQQEKDLVSKVVVTIGQCFKVGDAGLFET